MTHFFNKKKAPIKSENFQFQTSQFFTNFTVLHKLQSCLYSRATPINVAEQSSSKSLYLTARNNNINKFEIQSNNRCFPQVVGSALSCQTSEEQHWLQIKSLCQQAASKGGAYLQNEKFKQRFSSSKPEVSPHVQSLSSRSLTVAIVSHAACLRLGPLSRLFSLGFFFSFFPGRYFQHAFEGGGGSGAVGDVVPLQPLCLCWPASAAPLATSRLVLRRSGKLRGQRSQQTDFPRWQPARVTQLRRITEARWAPPAPLSAV